MITRILVSLYMLLQFFISESQAEINCSSEMSLTDIYFIDDINNYKDKVGLMKHKPSPAVSFDRIGECQENICKYTISLGDKKKIVAELDYPSYKLKVCHNKELIVDEKYQKGSSKVDVMKLSKYIFISSEQGNIGKHLIAIDVIYGISKGFYTDEYVDESRFRGENRGYYTKSKVYKIDHGAKVVISESVTMNDSSKIDWNIDFK